MATELSGGVGAGGGGGGVSRSRSHSASRRKARTAPGASEYGSVLSAREEVSAYTAAPAHSATEAGGAYGSLELRKPTHGAAYGFGDIEVQTSTEYMPIGGLTGTSNTLGSSSSTVYRPMTLPLDDSASSHYRPINGDAQ